MDIGKVEDCLVGDDQGRLDTVRVLHQTVVTLRLALEQSRAELNSLREQVKTNVDPNLYTSTIENLAVENHVLRQKVLSRGFHRAKVLKMSDSVENEVFEGVNGVEEKQEEKEQTPRVSKGDSEESEEVDDIELIFTTEDTKELNTFQEDLVSIAEDGWRKDDDKETHSVLVETDISKCGVIEENEGGGRGSRRNTLPAPPPYRIVSVGGSRGKLNDTRSPVRPILVEKNSPKRESGAQTDITALPLHWKSESFLAKHRVSHTFTTLPSKFALPLGHCNRRQSLRLSEKTQEARRVLLSDINFTSMVPELSRSADHLCHDSLVSRYPRAVSYMKAIDGPLKWSPCDCHSRVWDCSSTSIHPSTLDIDARRRHSMRPSLDSYWAGSSQRPNWASVPSSPTHFNRSRSVPFSASYLRCTTPQSEASTVMTGPASRRHQSSYTLKTPRQNVSRTKVKFQEWKCGGCCGKSLPDLRLPVGDGDEDSTDSLIAESEDYLRRSIDSMLSGSEPQPLSASALYSASFLSPPGCESGRRRGVPGRAQPFLCKAASELRTDYWVKAIAEEGRVVVGRVRYVGPLPGLQSVIHVGLELDQPTGNTDGSYATARFFTCEVNCGLFVPFKKVIMAWSV